jgi:hypothetical protein
MPLDIAGDTHFSLVGTLHAVQDLHQRRLACTVLAADRMDFALLDREVDVVIRNNTRKTLCDPNQFDCRY